MLYRYVEEEKLLYLAAKIDLLKHSLLTESLLPATVDCVGRCVVVLLCRGIESPHTRR